MIRGYFHLGIILFLIPTLGFSQKTVLENQFRVKFSEKFASQIQNQKFSQSANGVLNVGDTQIDQLNTMYGVYELVRLFPVAGKFEEKHRKHGLHLWYTVKFKKTSEVSSVCQSFSALPSVLQANPVYIQNFDGHSVDRIESVNDPRFKDQWHYDNTGQTNGIPGADISLVEAWNVTAGDPRVIVSVFDSGIDPEHPDLINMLWTNPGEIPNDGVDNDNNGYVDDIHGWNFAGELLSDDPQDLYDYNGHGTHTSGTIAAENNNGIGVSGIAGGSGIGDGARIMTIKFGDSYGSNSIYVNPAGYVYAADMGSTISSNSWGGGSYDPSIEAAFNYFIEESTGNGVSNGGIIITAAGNSSNSIKDWRSEIPGVLMVAALNHNDQMSYYTNYGNWVDISAPGGETWDSYTEGVLSTTPNGGYSFYQGTSMACPHVSGVAALALSLNSGLNTQTLFDLLINSVDSIDVKYEPNAINLGSGRINALKAVSNQGGVSNLQITPTSLSNLEIQKGSTFTQTIKLVNESNFDVDVELILPEGSENWLNVDKQNILIGANSLNRLSLSLTGDIAGNSYEEDLIFSYTSKNGKVSQKLPIQMFVLGDPKLATQEFFDFDSVYVGYEASSLFLIENTGPGYLEINQVEYNQSDYSLSFDTLSLSPNDTAYVRLAFNPTKDGDINGRISLVSNDPTTPIFEIEVLGKGLNRKPPTLVLDYTNPVIESISGRIEQSITLNATNTGDDPLKVFVPEIQNLNYAGNTIWTYNSPFGVVKGLAMANKRYIWGYDAQDNWIKKYDLEDEIIVDSIQNASESGSSLVIYENKLIQLDANFKRLYIYDTLSTSLISEVQINCSEDLEQTLAIEDDKLWIVGRNNSNSSSKFIQIDMTGNVQLSLNSSYYSSGLVNINGLFVDDFFFFTLSRDRVYVFDKSNGNNVTDYYLSGLLGSTSDISDIAFDGDFFYFHLESSEKRLVKVDFYHPVINNIPSQELTIAPQSNQNITIPIDAYVNYPGNYKDVMFISSNDPENSWSDLTLQSKITGQPSISLNFDISNYDVYANYEGKANLIITNSGFDTLLITDITQSSDHFTFENIPISLPPKTVDSVEFRYFFDSPNEYFNGQITVQSNASNNYDQTRYYNFRTTERPQLTLSGTNFNLELFEGGRGTSAFSITNITGGALNYEINIPKRTVNDGSDFSVESVPPNYYFGGLSWLNGLNNSTFFNSQVDSLYQFLSNYYSYYIYDDKMYPYSGNYLSIDGYNVDYSNGRISTLNEKEYFTYQSNSFWFASFELDNANEFDIKDEYYEYPDSTQTVELSKIVIDRGDREYAGFIKRAFGHFRPSINQLIIVENKPEIVRQYSEENGQSSHIIDSLNNVNQLHYILFTGNLGLKFEDDDFAAIMVEYLDILYPNQGLNLNIPTAGTLYGQGNNAGEFSYDALNEKPGDYKLSGNITSNDPEKDHVALDFNIKIKSAPNLYVNYGSSRILEAFINENDRGRIQLRNTGSESLEINDIKLFTTDNFKIGNDYSLPISIEPGNRVDFELIFNPKESGLIRDSLVFSSNDPDMARTIVSFIAIGKRSRLLSVNKDSISASLNIGQQETFAIPISNDGGDSLSYQFNIVERKNPFNVEIAYEKIIEKSGIRSNPVLVSFEDSLNGSYYSNDPAEIAGYTKLRDGGFGNILLLTNESSNAVRNVSSDLFSSGYFESVSYITLSDFSLSYEDIKEYDAILYFSSYSRYINDPSSVGDALADFANSGKLILMALDETCRWQLRGNWYRNRAKYSTYSIEPNIYYNDYDVKVNIDSTISVLYRNVTPFTPRYIAGYTPLQNHEIIAKYSDGSFLLTKVASDTLNILELAYRPTDYNVDNDFISNTIRHFLNKPQGSEVSWLTSNKYSGKIASTSSDTLSITINTEKLNEGNYESFGYLYSDDSKLRIPEITFKLEAVGAPEISISDSILFKNTTIGFSEIKNFYILNDGNGKTSIDSIRINSPYFEVLRPIGSSDIRPFSRTEVLVSFNPDEAINYSATGIAFIKDSTYQFELSALGMLPGKFSYSPDTIRAAFNLGEVATASATIENKGNGVMNFSFEKFQAQKAIDQIEITNEAMIIFDPLMKGQTDFRKGHEVLFGAGQDSFGYTFIDSDQENGPDFMWSSIADEGIKTTLSDDDSFEVILPFEFELYGLRYETIYISSNGYLSVEKTSAFNPINQQIPNSNFPNGIIAGFWKDLNPEINGDIYYQLLEDRLIVEYDNISDFEQSGNYTFQIVLFKNGDIELSYNQLSGKTDDVTTGIENALGNVGLNIVFNNDYLHDQFAIRIHKPQSLISPNITSGTLEPGDSVNINFEFNSGDLFGGTYYEELIVFANDTSNAYTPLPFELQLIGTPLVHISDTLFYDTTYVGKPNWQGAYVTNTGTDILLIDSVTSTNSSFFPVFPSYQALVKSVNQQNDSTRGILRIQYDESVLSLNGFLYNLEGTHLKALLKLDDGSENGETLMDIKITQPAGSSIWNINASANKLKVEKELLNNLNAGKVFFVIYSDKYQDGESFGYFQPEVTVYVQDSYKLGIVYQPQLSGIDSAEVMVYSNAGNQNPTLIKAYGTSIDPTAVLRTNISEIKATLNAGDSVNQSMTIINEGVDSLFIRLLTAGRTYESNRYNLSNLKMSTNSASYSDEEIAEMIGQVPTLPLSESINEIKTERLNSNVEAFGLVNNFNQDLFIGKIDFSDPKSLESVFVLDNYYARGYPSAGEFLTDQYNILYELTESSELAQIDLVNNQITFLGYLYPTQGGKWTGMATDPISGTLYACTSNSLYIVDIEQMSSEFIGYTGTDALVAIAIDNNQNLYGYDVSDDQFVTINAETGQAYDIGYIGFNANFTQGMFYDIKTDQLIISAYNYSNRRSEWRLVNRITGNTELISQIGEKEYSGQVGMGYVATPLSPSLIRFDSTKLILAAGESIEVNVTIVADSSYKAGKYKSNLIVNSNDQVNPSLSIPIDIRVKGQEPIFTVDQTSFSFEATVVKDTISKYMTIQNDGLDILKLKMIMNDNNYHMESTLMDSLILDIGESQTLRIDYIPLTIGLHQTTIAIGTNDPENPLVHVDLSGAGKNAPYKMRLSESSMNPTMYRSENMQVELLVTNFGVGKLNWSIDTMNIPSWLSMNMHLDTLLGGDTSQLLMNLSSEKLEVSSYRDTLTFHTNDPVYDGYQFFVDLDVLNHKPTIDFVPEDIYLGIQEDTFKIAKSVFNDADLDPLTHHVTFSNNNIIGLVDTETELWFFGDTAGKTIVNVSTKDDYLDSASISFSITANTRPKYINQMDTIQMYHWLSDNSLKVDLNDWFDDDDNDELSFQLNFDNQFTEASISTEGILSITSLRSGNEHFLITATDNYSSREGAFVVDNVSKADMPVLMQLSANQLNVDTYRDMIIELEILISNGGNNELNWSIEQEQIPSWVSLSIASDTLAKGDTSSVLLNINSEGLNVGNYQASLLIKTNDPLYDGFNIVVDLDVLNQSPVIDFTMEDVYLGITEDTLKINKSIFSDLEMDPLTNSISISNQDLIGVIETDSEFWLFGLSAGQTNATLISKDSYLDSSYVSFSLTTNTRPEYINPMDSIQASLDNNSDELVFDLFEWFIDADGDMLSFELKSENSEMESYITTQGELFLNSISSGTASYTIVASDQFSSVEGVIFVLTSPLSIKEISMNTEIYPNPADNHLTILLKNFDRNNLKVELFNMAGKKITDIYDGNNLMIKQKLRTENFVPGVYIVRFIDRENHYDRKIIIKH